MYLATKEECNNLLASCSCIQSRREIVSCGEVGIRVGYILHAFISKPGIRFASNCEGKKYLSLRFLQPDIRFCKKVLALFYLVILICKVKMHIDAKAPWLKLRKKDRQFFF